MRMNRMKHTLIPGDKITLDLPREKATPAQIADLPSADQLFTITTVCGEIRGIRQNGWVEFRGVPYATAERFEQAVPVTSWEGVYDATRWGDRCCQHNGFFAEPSGPISRFYLAEAIAQRPAGYREDALELNIWAPEDAGGCPVLFYIHGGSFQSGSNTDVTTNGVVYAQNGVVTVSINYRLSVFATANDGGKHRGNLAVTDQIAALRWVHEHIADFGGDPARITIMGESAGAVSIQNLLVSPLVDKGLIHGAIMLSGGGYLSYNPVPEETNRAFWRDFLAHMGVSSVDELKAFPARELYTEWMRSSGARPGSNVPCINGISLTDSVASHLERGTVQDVPVIIGMLSEDCFLRSLFSAAKGYAEGRSRTGNKPVYLFFFDRCQPGDTTFGAFHAADLYYVFGSLHRGVRPYDETDYRISAQMISYFLRFIFTGDPNGGDLHQWEPATASRQHFLHFGDEDAAMIFPDEERIRYNAEHKPDFPYLKDT